jgi:hypothetical protein
MAVLGAEFSAGHLEGGREAAAVVSQHVGDPERKGRRRLAQERHGAFCGHVVLGRQVH